MFIQSTVLMVAAMVEKKDQFHQRFNQEQMIKLL